MNAPPAASVFEEPGNSSVFAFHCSADVRRLFAQAFERPGLGDLTQADGGPDAALRALRRGEKPGLLMVDLSASERPAEDIDRLVRQGPRGLAIVGVGNELTMAQFREICVAGAADYLDKAMGPAGVAEAVSRMRRMRARHGLDSGPVRQARVILFIGTRGGLGTSSVAASAAWVLANKADRNTLLLDLDVAFGTTAFSLDIDPGHALRDVLRQPSRIDVPFIERSVVRQSDRLAILSGEEGFESDPAIDPAAAGILLEEVRQTFDCVVVDMPRGNSNAQQAILASATDIVLVGALTLSSLRDSLCWLRWLPRTAPGAAIRFIVGPGGQGRLPRAEFERNLERAIDVVVPADARAHDVAANAAKPLPEVAGESQTTKAIEALVESLGYGVPAAPDPWWHRLRGRAKGAVG
jgi:pilus assembly protein CpaE